MKYCPTGPASCMKFNPDSSVTSLNHSGGVASAVEALLGTAARAASCVRQPATTLAAAASKQTTIREARFRSDVTTTIIMMRWPR